MFTYKVDDIVIDNENPIYPNLPGSAGDITQHPEFLNLTGANFNGASVEGCKLTGTSYLCKAIEDISVSGTYTVAQGYEVNVEAGNEINIAPETLTPPEMQFSIVPVYDYSNPMPPVDAPFVKSFCSSTGTYSANLSKNAGKSMMSGGSEESEDTEIEMRSYEQGQEEMGEFYFDLYPNPTSGGATVEFLLTEQAKVNLYVTELSGKVVLSQLSERNLFEGKQKYALNTETLSNGIYLVVLQINGVPNVVKLIKN
jgi:hypothetical protein